MSKKLSRTTGVIRTQKRTEFAEHSEPMFLTSSFVFESAEHAASVFAREQEGFVYSRYTNPTVDLFTDRLALMEDAEAGIATASGMSALLAICMMHLNPGDHVLCSRDVFGTTRGLFGNLLSRFGIDTNFVPLCDADAWRERLSDRTRLLVLETPSNPLGDVADIALMAEIAHERDALLLIDNCFCTPALQQPLALGADLVMHSATKYLDGQGRCLGGAVLGSAELIAPLDDFLRVAGPALSPFNAWVMAKSLETLELRMQAHSRGALQVAEWLQEHPRVEQVHYVGLPTHPGHGLAKRQQSDFGGVLAFEIKSTLEDAWACMDRIKMLSITPNLGDTKTTIGHPASTTHARLSDDEKLESGIKPNLIRLAVGLEDPQDIIADLAQSLDDSD